MISKQLKNLKNKKIGNWKYLKSLKNCTEHVKEFAEMEKAPVNIRRHSLSSKSLKS